MAKRSSGRERDEDRDDLDRKRKRAERHRHSKRREKASQGDDGTEQQEELERYGGYLPPPIKEPEGSGRGPGIYWSSLMGNQEEGIGGNAHLYEVVDDKGNYGAAIVDIGLKFGDPPMMADVIEALKKTDDIIITHGHLDHIGGIAHLFTEGMHDVLKKEGIDMAKKRIHAPPLARELIYDEMVSANIPLETNRGKQIWPNIKTYEPGMDIDIGPMKVKACVAPHSIPQAMMLNVYGPDGVLHKHSGDFKMDDTSIVGWDDVAKKNGHKDAAAMMYAELERDKEHGVRSITVDSTSTLSNEHTRPEAEVEQSLKDVFKENKDSRIVYSILSTNVTRIVQAGRAAVAAGKTDMVLEGWTLNAMMKASQQSGFDIGKMIDPKGKFQIHSGYSDEAEKIQKERPESSVVVASGAFGQDTAALPKALKGEHKRLEINNDSDVIIVAQGPIPPVRDAYQAMMDSAHAKGVTMIVPKVPYKDEVPESVQIRDGIYESGHAKAKDVDRLLDLTGAKTMLPIHGNFDQLAATADVAKAKGIEAFIQRNVESVRITNDNVAGFGDKPPPERAITCINETGDFRTPVYSYELYERDPKSGAMTALKTLHKASEEELANAEAGQGKFSRGSQSYQQGASDRFREKMANKEGIKNSPYKGAAAAFEAYKAEKAGGR